MIGVMIGQGRDFPSPVVSIDEESVRLQWQTDSRVLLQRFVPGLEEDWEDLTPTIGKGAFTEARRDRLMLYRLVRLNEDEAARLSLRLLVHELATNQLRRAMDGTFDSENATLPPDDGDASWPMLEANDSEAPARAWASQPGMIRVYHSGESRAVRALKLYSSADAVISPGESLREDEHTLTDWVKHPNRFVDLNEPSGEGEARSFPILDPRAMTEHRVEGLSFERAPGSTNLPMPVAWLYQLEDGSLGTLNEAGTWMGEGEATAANPIVARLAFWMDDETSKVNVNTASEGVFWDFPRADTPQERLFATRQPVRGEVQRYPGHPAMTCLSSILFPGKATNHPDETRRLTNAELDILYGLTPRVTDQGTNGGARMPIQAATFDGHPLHGSISEWEAAAGVPQGRFSGLLTTQNAAPETTLYGRPRMSIWPIPSEIESRELATDYDRRSAGLASLGTRRFALHRRDALSRDDELYKLADRANVDLFRSLMGQVYRTPPGYAASLATKYGAVLPVENYADPTDYDKDPYQIAIQAFQHIRTTNLHDPDVAAPYTGGDQVGLGQVTGFGLSDRDLQEGTGGTGDWFAPTLEPHAAGRRFTVSEIVLVAYNTGEATLQSWRDGRPRLTGSNGPDTSVMGQILANSHPEYAKWRGRPFGEEDVGKIFRYVEVGLILEVFSPAMGYPNIQPVETIRLMTRGEGYRGGVAEIKGLKLNGVPLELWGEAVEVSQPRFGGPAISTVDPRDPIPRPEYPEVWRSLGGHGGPRLFRFGTFTIAQGVPGFRVNFLANGRGPLANFYCQTPVILREDEDLILTQEEPLQIALYEAVGRDANLSTLTQVLNVRFVQPGGRWRMPAPERNSGGFSGWTRRHRTSAQSVRAVSLLEPVEDRESVKGVMVAHGDHRHVAAKRKVPSELLRIHPLATEKRAAHSLMWARPDGARIETDTSFAPDLYGRGLVEGVDYAEEALPDFTADPAHRGEFAPLLGENYHFPIDPTITRDFDTGLAREPDGAYLNSPNGSAGPVPGGSIFNQKDPYFDDVEAPVAPISRSFRHFWFPRGMAPSPVAMGSIPSAVQANAPWTCLLFRPNVSDPNQFPHLGERGNGMVLERYRRSWDGFELPQMVSVTGQAGLPPDHLWLDLFWMPTAEPDHVSTAFATEGKVNLNYQMLPFTHIKRATAMHAVLKAERLLAIPTSAGPTYKSQRDNPDWRHPIDVAETLRSFEEKFARDEIFLTESEVCEQFLIPEGERWDAEGEGIRAFWDEHRLSGDNVLERPYAGLYSRLTTRSNVYRLHYRVQRLAKHAESSPGRFEPELDSVIDEQRGSSIIKRVLDTDHPDLPNYARDPDRLPSIDAFYEFRVREIENH